MKNNILPKPRARTSVSRALTTALFLVLLNTFAAAQGSNTDGTTPAGMKPGAPAGSYGLTGFENVNLYNGNLNFSMPLLQVGGRGGAGYTVPLVVEQKWRVETWPESFPGQGPIYVPLGTWWADLKPGYGPGVLEGRRGGYEDYPFEHYCGSQSSGFYNQMLTRLTFTASDGTEFELRDQLTNGEPKFLSGIPCESPGSSRGTVFNSADATAATFISDTTIYDHKYKPMGVNDQFRPSGYLMLRDGTRYRIENGLVIWLRDRNGNRLTFVYDGSGRVTTVTDSINRQVSFSYSGTNGFSYDLITYKGFGGQARSIKVWKTNLGNVLRSGYSLQTYAQLFPNLTGASSFSSFNPSRVSAIELPDGRSYQLRYNSYGELARVELPTGGAFEYDWIDANSLLNEGVIYRRVSERRVYANGTTLEGKTTYSDPGTGEQVVVRGFDPAGTLKAYSAHYFHGNALNSMSSQYNTPVSYGNSYEGREYKTESFDIISGSPVLRRRVTQTWQTRTSHVWAGVDPRVTETSTTLVDSNQISKQTFGYDDTVPFNNQNNVKEYAFGSGSPGALVRETRTTYLTAASYTGTNVHVRGLATQVSVYEGAVERARTVNEFDNYATDTNHAALVNRANISGLDPAFTTAYTTRGNITSNTSYLLVNGSVTGSIVGYSQFDIAGNVVKAIDGMGNATLLEYDDCFGTPEGNARINSAPLELSSASKTSFAFVTKVTKPLNLITFSQFDYYLGQPVDAEDENGIVSSGSYNDLLDRPTQVRRAAGTTLTNQTTFSYDDSNRVITTSSDLNANNDNVLTSKTFYDGLGRTTETRQYEGGTNYIASQIQYDFLGRGFKSSNPFRHWQSETPVWTTTGFDGMGRVISVTTPDNAVVTTSYSGNTVTITDQAGKARKSVTDALGRLIEVYEDPNGLNYQTTYNYDVLDNLVKVTQGSQQRFFMYDSLKRLIRARNPEQSTLAILNLSDPITGNSAWSIGYQYDPNGNLTQKTDARGVVSTYVYDNLNRNTTVNYSDTTINPDVTRFYDGAINGKGRFWYFYSGGDFSNGTNVEATAIDSYDALGRPLIKRQLFKLNGTWDQTYQTLRDYNLAGGVRSQTYPSGRTVNYTYDSAGRTGEFTGNLGDNINRTYASEIIYSSLGGMSKEKFGTTTTPLYNKLFYNNRGQLAEIRVGTTYTGPTDTGWQRGAIINHYSGQCSGACTPTSNMTDNNGNLKQQEHFIPDGSGGVQAVFAQNYDYDSLNRLQRVREGNWQQEYVYDRWGNRTIHQTNTYGTGIPKPNFGVTTADNRLTAPAGFSMTYDAAGNLTADTYTGAGNRVYDAENRMTQAWGGNNQWQHYTYNGDGQRTRRKVDGQETWQVYGIDGELLAEYPVSGAPASPQKEYGYRNGQLLVTAAINSSAGGSPPTSGLAGYWKFDENTGTSAADSSGNGNTGTLTSGSGWATGQSGSAVSLDGVNDYVQVGAPSSLVMTSVASFSAWINPTGAGSNATLGGAILVKEGEYVMARFPDGTIQWGFANSNPGWSFVNTGYVAPLNQWTHIAVTYDNGTIKTYANGNLVHTHNGSGSIGDAITAQNDFRIGGRQVISQHFQGRIDEVRVYNRVLSSAEVTELLGGLTSVLRGHWKLDENTGTSAADSSGNGYTGTLTSGSGWATGQSGSAVSLDGVDDYVQVGAQSSLVMTSVASFSAWINPTGAGSNATLGGTILVKEGEYVMARFPDGTIQWGFANSSPGWSFVNTGYVAPLNQWTHLAVTYDNGTIKTYANGNLVHTHNGSGSIGDAITAQNDFRIGGRQVISQHFQGRIDEVRVYNRALNASEVSTLPSGAPGGGVDFNWLVTDQLGTPRMVFDQTGSLANVKRHDYLPFGEELFAPAGGRSAAMGYASGDGVRQQFTSKERDVETGLDYFLARYYSNTQGRFTSPDVLFADQWEAEPQSWNLYTYVGNSPTNTIDPFGLWKKVDCGNGGDCWEAEEGDTWATLAQDARFSGLPAETGAYLADYFQNVFIVPGVTTVDVSLFLAWKQNLSIQEDLKIRLSVPIEVDFGGGGGLRNVAKAASKSGLFSRLGRWLGLGKKAGELTQEAIRAGRQAYVAEVKALATTAAELRAAGHSVEEIAIKVHAERRALGVKYKDATPPELLNRILERNIQVYGDALGPTIEWLRSRGKTWEQIIESASRSGGEDLFP